MGFEEIGRRFEEGSEGLEGGAGDAVVAAGEGGRRMCYSLDESLDPF